MLLLTDISKYVNIVNVIIHKNNCNIFDGGAQAIIHQANCFNTMGGGIALQIRQRYPEVYDVDCETVKGSREKLGCFSWVKTKDGKFYIYNCYSQFKYSGDKRNTNYEAVFTGLTAIRSHAILHNLTILSLPYMMGCGLGGGSWKIVKSIIEEIFEDDSQITLYICNYNPYE